MNEHHVEGALDQTKGAIKDAAGKVMGDKAMQADGKMDKAKSAAHKVAGNATDAMKREERAKRPPINP